jgi:predicted lipoprotein with Yx(FWY)xxD motif
MSERGRGLLVVGAALLVVVAVATGLASSAPAASSGATRLTVRSTEFGKAVFGPNGKVVYAFGDDRGTTSRC